MLNFVKVSWRVKRPQRGDTLRRLILNDPNLSWAAKGLGCYLSVSREWVRFPNRVWDGTMNALDELMLQEYIWIEKIEDGDE